MSCLIQKRICFVQKGVFNPGKKEKEGEEEDATLKNRYKSLMGPIASSRAWSISYNNCKCALWSLHMTLFYNMCSSFPKHCFFHKTTGKSLKLQQQAPGLPGGSKGASAPMEAELKDSFLCKSNL